jgi:hypothetical protein
MLQRRRHGDRDRDRDHRRYPRRGRRGHRGGQWYFLGCARSSMDCDWAALRRGFNDSYAQYDTWNCRSRRAPYACYAHR